MMAVMFYVSGGCDDILKANSENRLLQMVNGPSDFTYDFDLVVIGGGSGGLAAFKVSRLPLNCQIITL